VIVDEPFQLVIRPLLLGVLPEFIQEPGPLQLLHLELALLRHAFNLPGNRGTMARDLLVGDGLGELGVEGRRIRGSYGAALVACELREHEIGSLCHGHGGRGVEVPGDSCGFLSSNQARCLFHHSGGEMEGGHGCHTTHHGQCVLYGAGKVFRGFLDAQLPKATGHCLGCSGLLHDVGCRFADEGVRCTECFRDARNEHPGGKHLIDAGNNGLFRVVLPGLSKPIE